MRSVASRPGRKAIVANGAEGEPASRKDRLLLSRLPHLVLDGIALAAAAVGADEAYLCVHGTESGLLRRLDHAVAERQAAGLDPVPIQVTGIPARYVSSEQSSIVQFLNGGPGKPTFSPPRPHERGLNGKLTMVHNVETLALQHLLASPPDLILLDLGLPDVSGYEALRMVRAVSSVPVVVVTARDDEADIIRVLDAGADDYVVKPFGPGQIEARIRAVLRRTPAGDPGPAALLTVGGLRLDPDGHEATLDDAPLDLSRREFDLLHYLALRAGQVVTRRDLLTHVWRLPYGGADKTVDVHVSWLRRKLGETAQHPRYLHTVRGVGIKLSPPP